MSLRVQLLKAAKGSVLLRVVSLASGLLGSVVLARALGPAPFGVYSFAFAVVSLLAVPSQAGIPTLLVRETARLEAEQAWGKLKGLWQWATRAILGISAVSALLVFIAIQGWPTLVEPGSRETLLVGLVLVPLMALGDARGAALRGLRMIVRGQMPETVIRPLLLVTLVGGAWLFGTRPTPVQTMGWHVVAATIAFIFGALVLAHARPAGVSTAVPDFSGSRDWRAATLPLALITGLQVASNQSGILLLGLFRPDAEIGLFRVAVSASSLALFGLQTTNLVAAPHFARLHATGERDRLQRLAGVTAVASLALTLPIALAFVFGGRWLVGLLYGHAYVAAWLPLVILVAGNVVNAGTGSVGLLLVMTGHERETARLLSISAVINVGLGVALIPAFGAMGAAIAASTATAYLNVAMWRLARLRLGIDGSAAGPIHEVLARKLRQ